MAPGVTDTVALISVVPKVLAAGGTFAIDHAERTQWAYRMRNADVATEFLHLVVVREGIGHQCDLARGLSKGE